MLVTYEYSSLWGNIFFLIQPVQEKPFSPPKIPAVPYRKQVRSGSKENGKYGLGKRGIRGRRIYRGRARGRYRFGKYSAARGRGRQKGRGHRKYHGQGKGRGRGKDQDRLKKYRWRG